MFDEMDKHIAQKGKTPLQLEMIDCIPQIYNALFPSATSMATEARSQLHATKTEAERMLRQNSMPMTSQRVLIEQILGKIQSIANRATKLVQQQKIRNGNV